VSAPELTLDRYPSQQKHVASSCSCSRLSCHVPHLAHLINRRLICGILVATPEPSAQRVSSTARVNVFKRNQYAGQAGRSECQQQLLRLTCRQQEPLLPSHAQALVPDCAASWQHHVSMECLYSCCCKVQAGVPLETMGFGTPAPSRSWAQHLLLHHTCNSNA